MNMYAVMLRGVNIGGVKLAMSDLRNLAENLGYAGAKTVLASGNLLVKTEDSADTVKRRVTESLSEFMHRHMHCVVRSRVQIERLLEQTPDAPEGFHHYILFSDAPVADELIALYSGYPLGEGERLFALLEDLHWIVKKGDTLKGFGSTALGNKKYQAFLTSRNLNTVQKIMHGLQAL